MSGIFGEASIQRSGKAILLCLAGSFITGLLLSGEAYATENGASVYPLGVDTVLGGMMPPPKETKFFVFESFYSANEKDNSAGQSVVPEFKIRVFASAVRVAHNWGVPVLGGRLESLFAVPVVYEQLHIAPGKYDKTGKLVHPIMPHSIPMVMLGTFILAFGWFGFNPGSSLAGTDLRIAVVAVNTMLASATAAFSTMLYMWWVKTKKPDPSMMCNGMLAGLVAITAPCGRPRPFLLRTSSSSLPR